MIYYASIESLIILKDIKNTCTFFYRIKQYIIKFDFFTVKKRHKLDVDNLYMWAKSLKHLDKTEVALKKVEEAIHLDSLDRKTMMVREEYIWMV